MDRKPVSEAFWVNLFDLKNSTLKTSGLKIYTNGKY